MYYARNIIADEDNKIMSEIIFYVGVSLEPLLVDGDRIDILYRIGKAIELISELVLRLSISQAADIHRGDEDLGEIQKAQGLLSYIPFDEGTRVEHGCQVLQIMGKLLSKANEA